MNIAYFLLPKSRIAYLYDDFTIRQGLEKMRNRGYTAIPVITRDGRYMGTVSEGDFLWRLLSEDRDFQRSCSMRDMEQLRIRDILQDNSYPPVRITVGMEELLHSAMNQNFIPPFPTRFSTSTSFFFPSFSRKILASPSMSSQ